MATMSMNEQEGMNALIIGDSEKTRKGHCWKQKAQELHIKYFNSKAPDGRNFLIQVF